MTTENNKKESIVPKSVKERNNLDLLELVCQLHYRALQYQTEDLHNAYVEARTELETRFPATPIEGEQESELNAIVDKNVKLFKNLRVIELAKELGHETINEKCFICGQSYNIPIDEYLSYKEKQFPASQFTPSKEKEYREALEFLVRVKDYKDEFGKDNTWYDENQPKAWEQARKALNK